MTEKFYNIRDTSCPEFEAKCAELGVDPTVLKFRRARSGDPWREDHEWMGGYWYVATDGLVDFWAMGYGFEAVAPIVVEQVNK